MKDRTFKLLLALIAAALWAIVLRPVWTPETARAQADTTASAAYEYWIVVHDNPDKLEKALDEAGREGWRAAGFGINPQNGFRQPQIAVLMERRTN